ncbi:enamine deaminase RidA (YjgF/YER057c/UK114 family) [Crossiella equi]|uniref:Enamine deaminase RidA (YjgF/YER057c/UK114 family) n=1 Tax=Crossiella equi TaxID=130796 RepID=A0ABS5A8W2_9PSEU|nr:RidA family protein [Crossiella equi]MBP2473014.1 enamine deaminase RidA (YjgF/YER057c/UK114 family) [Crossiella equi]
MTRINPPELPRPSGFSHAVVTTGARTVHLAGQTALDASGKIIDGDVVAQFDQALSNLLTALAAAGGTPADLATLTVFLVDVEDYKANAARIGEVWRTRVGKHYPAMAAIGISRLWDVEALVEVQGTAVLP